MIIKTSVNGVDFEIIEDAKNVTVDVKVDGAFNVHASSGYAESARRIERQAELDDND